MGYRLRSSPSKRYRKRWSSHAVALTDSTHSVERILGHTNIETAQIYAKITVEKLDNDLTMLGDKLSKSFGNIKVAGI